MSMRSTHAFIRSVDNLFRHSEDAAQKHEAYVAEESFLMDPGASRDGVRLLTSNKRMSTDERPARWDAEWLLLLRLSKPSDVRLR